jgi:WD40 repeat protein
LQFDADDRRLSLTKLALGQKSRFSFLEVEESPVLHRIESGLKSKNSWSLTYSPDGRWLATADGLGEGVRLYDIDTRRLLAELPSSDGRMVLFEPGGKSLLTAERDGLIRWPLVESNALSGNVLQLGPRQRVSPLRGILYGALTPEGRWLACTQESSTNQVWLVDLTAPGKPIPLGRHSNVLLIGISPDGQWVTSGNWNGMTGVKVWNTHSRTLEKQFPMGGVMMAWSPDGRWLATSGTQTNNLNMYQVWDTRSWTVRHSFEPEHSHGSVAFSPDSRILALVVDHRFIRLHEAGTFRYLATLEAPEHATIAWIQFRPDGQQLAALEQNLGVQLWDLAALRRELQARGLDWETAP